MNDLDPKSMRMLMGVTVICIVFSLLVGHAYNVYKPQKSQKASYTQEDITRKVNAEVQRIESEKRREQELKAMERSIFGGGSANDIVDDEDIPEPVKLPLINKKKKDLPDLEPLSQDDLPMEAKVANGEAVSKVTNAYGEVFASAMKYKKAREYENSLAELKRALSLVENEEQKADCYEQAAIIHAKTKHYGSALSNAHKAYNCHPSASREALLARLYYRTGNVDRANNYIDKVLKKDFSLD